MTNKHKIIGWYAWFVDMKQTKVTRYCSKDIEWEDLPKDGCLLFKYFEIRKDVSGNHTNWITYGRDFHFKAEGVNDNIYGYINETDKFDRHVDIENRYVNPTIIRGIWTDVLTLQQVIAESETTKWQS